MNFAGVINRYCSNVLNSISNVQFIPVRHRYWAEKVKRNQLRDFGYKDKIFKSGLMPRLENAPKLPLPDYRPKNRWCKESALYGRNDYIDILGNNRLHPVRVAYSVPWWLKGERNNEMRLLILKTKAYGKGRYKYDFPSKWQSINKRIRYLYQFLNRKTRTFFMND